MHQVKFQLKKLGVLLLPIAVASVFLLVYEGVVSKAEPLEPNATYVSSNITSSTTWTKAGSPYYITNDIDVGPNVTLTIEPGVEIWFRATDNVMFRVLENSSIIAKGTETEHITIKTYSGYKRYKKIWFLPNSSSYLRYVDIAGGGASATQGNTILHYDGPGTHVLNNCSIRNSEQRGIIARHSGLDLRIAGTLFENNGTQSVVVFSGAVVQITGSTFNDTKNASVWLESAATITVTASNLANGVQQGVHNEVPATVCVYAQDNWWGAADGPNGGGGGACGIGSNSGSGSPVSTGVNWQNYRTSVAPHVGIRTAPVATFTVSPDPDVKQSLGTEYTFDASDSTDVEDYPSNLAVCWDWDNSGSCDTAWATTKTDTYSFTTGGLHTVRLAVRDTDGDTGELTRTVLSTYAPTATLTITQTSWSEFEFDTSGSDDVEDNPTDLKVRWDWEGDGVWDTGVYSVTDIVSHTYDHVGRYWPTVEVKDTEGAASTLSKPVDVIPPATSLPVSGGGMLVSADGTVTVTWASGVITDGAVITHTAWITTPVGSDSLPGDFTYQGFTLGAAFEGQPVEQTNGAYTITVSYDLDYYGGVLDLWASADLLRLYQWSEADGEWVLVTFTVDSGQLVATTDSFGHFALVSEPNKVYLPLVMSAY